MPTMFADRPDQSIRQVSEDYHPDDAVSVVGGGGSGLAAAYFLIEAGHRGERITISEKRSYLGGHARTVYLHKESPDALYAVQSYELDIDGPDIFLRFVDHTGAERRVQVNGNPDVIPVDTGVCGFSVHYYNFQHALSRLTEQEGRTFSQYDYLEEVSRSINLPGIVLRWDRPLGGQLWRPWNWHRVSRLKRDVPRMVAHCQERGLRHLQALTIAELLGELRAIGVSPDALELLCAFCQVGSGYSDAQFADISAGYLYTFFMQANLHNAGVNNTTFLYGVSAYLAQLVAHLRARGVKFSRTPDAAARHTIYAMQPRDAHKLNGDLPLVDRCRSVLYVHCDASIAGGADTVLTYGIVNGLAQATWDLDRMRPNLPDVGAFITFTTPDHEDRIDGQLFGDSGVTFLTDKLENGHNLYDAPLKKVWQHAVIDVPAEQARRDVWQHHQGRGNAYYCSSSYLYCMLHENAFTSALDVVCMMTGAHDRLVDRGFRPSDHTYELYGV